jgi:threonine/homoserine/homoserine lactone efflux protein
VFLSVGFLAITCYGHNYPRYLGLGVFPRYTFMTMQGRYAFPILALLVVVMCRTLLAFEKPALRGAIALASAGLILWLGFPGFLSRGASVTQNGKLQAEYRERLYHMHDFVDP